MLSVFLFLILFTLCAHGHEDEEGILEYLNPKEWLSEKWTTPSARPPPSDSCKALLPWACLCEPPVVNELQRQNTSKVESISCINTRMSTVTFLRAFGRFPNVQSVVIHGNDLRELPERFLGAARNKKLLYLNLTENNISCLHHDSLVSLPSLQSLDLSGNRIRLRLQTSDWAFLRPVRFLRRLLLRRAFHRKNNTAQVNLLEIGLRHAHLQDLQFLDLSSNAFDEFPARLVCWTPSLSHLILAHNHLRNFYIDEHCAMDELKVIDLQSNRLVHFTAPFASTAARLPPISVQVHNNPFDCSTKTCPSLHSIRWFRQTRVIKDKERVRCRANGDIWYMLYAPTDQTRVQCDSTLYPGGNRTTPKEITKKPTLPSGDDKRVSDEEKIPLPTEHELPSDTQLPNNSSTIGFAFASQTVVFVTFAFAAILLDADSL